MISPKRAKMVKEWLRHPYAWPGGYQQVLTMDTGEVMCHKCVKDIHFLRQIFSAWKGDGWFPSCADVIWEGDVRCDHCQENITAYGDPDADGHEDDDEVEHNNRYDGKHWKG